jgi:hypothetical protein
MQTPDDTKLSGKLQIRKVARAQAASLFHAGFLFVGFPDRERITAHGFQTVLTDPP